MILYTSFKIVIKWKHCHSKFFLCVIVVWIFYASQKVLIKPSCIYTGSKWPYDTLLEKFKFGLTALLSCFDNIVFEIGVKSPGLYSLQHVYVFN